MAAARAAVLLGLVVAWGRMKAGARVLHAPMAVMPPSSFGKDTNPGAKA